MAMSESQLTGVLIVVCVVTSVVLTLPLGIATGQHRSEYEFKSCRGWLAERDSATVIALKPECSKWTVPDKQHWQLNVPPSLR